MFCIFFPKLISLSVELLDFLVDLGNLLFVLLFNDCGVIFSLDFRDQLVFLVLNTEGSVFLKGMNGCFKTGG